MRELVVLISIISLVNCAKILGFFYFPSISHQFVFQSIMKGLSMQGHEVTFITPNPLKDPLLVNLTEIDVSAAYELFQKYDFSNFGRSTHSIIQITNIMNEFTEDVIDSELNNEDVLKLLERPKDAFDLIIIEPHGPVFFGLQRKFNAPIIAVSSLNVYSHYHYLAGNPTHPVLYPDFFSGRNGRQTSLMGKLDSLYIYVMQYVLSEFLSFPKANILGNKYFGNGATIKDIIKNTDMWMLNVNPIFSDKRPNVPNVIEFFNIHMKRNESFPKDLKQILDNARGGVVYFSLGTNVRFGHVQKDLKRTILEALGDLPYTVVCKWEFESVPDQPKNVHLRKWLPQQGILAHPNVKLFVTQGGLQSSEEAIINAVPLVVIPFLGDQPLNAKILTSNGIAETISPEDLNRDILVRTIIKVAKDEKYRNRAKELREIYLDQPQSGIDKVIWWCEYVIRHKGAKHLRSPSADIPLHEYFMLDVLSVISLSLYIIYKIIKLSMKLLIILYVKFAVQRPHKVKKN